jgi:hypothetical protein
MAWWHIVLVTTLVIEAITIFGRFFFKISSKDILTRIMHHYGWKKVIHVHHLFFGLLVLALAVSLDNSLGVDLGVGIVLSDIVHHFVTLWLIVGDPEFHLVYKNANMFAKEEKMEDRKIKRFFKKLFG